MALSSDNFDAMLNAKGKPAIVTNDEGDVAVEPSSIDLHLGPRSGFYEDKDEPVRVSDKTTYPEFTEQLDDGDVVVMPGEFILAHTQEVVHLPDDCVGFLHGRSSVGRLGQFVHNAGLVDAGFQGDLTLELYNASKNAIILEEGMRVCQMTVHRHEVPPNVGYSAHNGNKYQGQRGPTPSKLYEDFE